MPYPVPTLVKQLRGTAQPCRLVPNEPEPTGAPAPEPAFLTPAQAELWRETVAMAPAGLLKAADFATLLQYVIALDLYTRATEEINRDGYTQRSKGRLTVHPAVYVMNSQSIILRQCIQELGFSPAARTRINTHAGGAGETAGADTVDWEQLAMSYQ